MSYLADPISNSRVLLDSRLRSQDLQFQYNSRELTDQITQLRLKLESLRASHAQTLLSLKEQQDREYSATQSQHNHQVRQLQSRLTSMPVPDNVDSYSYLSRLREDNSSLHSALLSLQAQKRNLEDQAESLMRNELRPLESSMQLSRCQMERQVSETTLRHEQERLDMERRINQLDGVILQLNRQVADVTEETRRMDQINLKTELALKDDLQILTRELDNYTINNRELSSQHQQVRRDCQDNSRLARSVEKELSKVKQTNEQLRPKAKKLEDLVYGRGLSPQKASPVKSTKKSFSRRSPSKKKTKQ